MRAVLSFIFAFVASSLALGDYAQIVLGAKESVHPDVTAEQVSQWGLDFSSTAPHLFSSVSSLLQQWGNTIFPNGHTIVPCEIPPFTLFYHGWPDDELPPNPEWLAFDIEMSYGIMGGGRNSHLSTYQTTRPVKALYFDGESATLMGLGQLDTQMLHIFGNVSGPPRGEWMLSGEYARATGLCDWLENAGLRGNGWGYEGIIRMNAGFEMIWCNFTSPSLRLLTHLNVTAPQIPQKTEDEDDHRKQETLGKRQHHATSYYSLPPQPTRTDRSSSPSVAPLPPNWRWDPQREPFLTSQTWGWFSSATYHYGSSRNGPGLGEVRAKILNCGIMSYYASPFTNLTIARAETERERYNLTSQGHWKGEGYSGNRSLALTQLRRRRRYHHLEDATTHDASLMRNNTERVLSSLLSGNNSCSGADWVYMTNEIAQNVGLHLKQLVQVVDSFSEYSYNYTSLIGWMARLRSQSHMFYVGFLEYPTDGDSSWSVDSKLYRDTYSRCRYKYTRLMAPSEGMALTPEEDDVRWSVEETYGTICSILLSIGFQIEGSWAEHFNTMELGSPENEFGTHFKELASTWSDGIQQLMAWLGWEDEFTGCTEVCAWDERCYIPMWPLMRMNFGRHPRPPPDYRNGTHPPYPGYRPPPPDRTGEGRPQGRMPWYLADETELWEPRCVKMSHLMGR